MDETLFHEDIINLSKPALLVRMTSDFTCLIPTEAFMTAIEYNSLCQVCLIEGFA
jgi:hypothetical protein